MSTPLSVEAALVEWGERLFYPANRTARPSKTPRLTALSFGQRAAAVRARIEATVLRRAPQVMVKVTGGGVDGLPGLPGPDPPGEIGRSRAVPGGGCLALR